ncbi:3-oxoadipate enol-lactonase [Comamonas serinivorans]|uniref:3-oxoadipate enol-lactonase n=1 Tax=Comamonas serinivorans TaxID=1082851 RepID=A0A1Y0EM36_9BURK|nr:3-oxoadipate enol-lactonase [Comamonas serinivorans]ARU04468.1 3-oxoadipate enol-lactonase [Comamonas serinivorans]
MSQAALSLNTRRGAFRVTVDGDPDAPALILSNSLGTTLEMWDPQVAALAKAFRLVRYDTRGHGGSPVTPGPYDFDGLGQDVLAVLDALAIETAAFCGISMGGHTGLWLGVHAPARLRALAVCNSAARIGAASAWHERAAAVRANGAAGMQALADSAPGRWFSEGFIQAQPAVVQRAQAGLARIAPEGYAACCEALATSDLRDSLHRIDVPTLLLAGAHDPVTTVAHAQAMQAAIAGAQLAVVPASHLSNLEAPQAFEQVVLEFMASALVR